MSQSRALIAEDEPRLREQLAERLAKLWPELEVCAMVGDGHRSRAGARSISAKYPLPGYSDARPSGLEVARYASNRCHVAFITAYDEYAVAAFEQGAVDYVLKPFTAARLATTIARLKERMVSPPPT
jgi:DNA-binding LytR/AlgR family response regulator